MKICPTASFLFSLVSVERNRNNELTYAKEQRVCIIPILLTSNWKPTGWLCFTISGHKWINFRDIDKNMDLRMQQLVGKKLNCFQDVKPLNFTHDTSGLEEEHETFPMVTYEEQNLDPNSYYRLTTQWQGDDKSLSVVNDGKNNNQLILAKTGNYSGQRWKITKI